MRSALLLSLLPLLGLLLTSAPTPALAQAQTDVPPPSPWTPLYPTGQALPAHTTRRQFWPILLERFCTGPTGQLRTDRSSTCKVDIADKLPSAPIVAERRLATWLDNSITSSARTQHTKTKMIDLRGVTLDNLLKRIQPANDAAAGGQGSPAQSEAVSSVTPVPQAGTKLAIAGTPAGMRVLAGLSVNPAGMITTSMLNDPSSQRTGTMATRLGDLSLVVPVDPSGTSSGSGLGSFDFVGVRLRVNASPFLKESLYDRARTRTLDMFNTALATEGSAGAEIEGLLSAFDKSGCAATFTGPGRPADPACEGGITDPDAFAKMIDGALKCAEALDSAVQERIAADCGKPLSSFGSVVKAEADLHRALRDLRDQHDAGTLGLDARYDYGDPTFSMNPAARGSHLLVGLAAGHRFLRGPRGDGQGPARPFFGLRVRAGYQLTSLNNNRDKVGSIDFAGGIETGVISELTVFKVTVGVEGRHTWRTLPTNADTNFVDFKIGIDIPLSDGSRSGALLSLPLDGSHGTILSLTGNWNTLTGALAK